MVFELGFQLILESSLDLKVNCVDGLGFIYTERERVATRMGVRTRVESCMN